MFLRTRLSVVLLPDLLSLSLEVFLVLVNFVPEFILKLLRKHSLVLISRVMREGMLQYLSHIVPRFVGIVSPSHSGTFLIIRKDATKFSCFVPFRLPRDLNSLVIFFPRISVGLLYTLRLHRYLLLAVALLHFYISLVLWVGKILPSNVFVL